MKKFNVLQIVSFCLLIIIVSSCSSIKNNFQSQKYTNFKKGESTAIRNQVSKEKNGNQLLVAVSENKEAEKPLTIIANEPSEKVIAPVSEINKIYNTAKPTHLFSNEQNKTIRTHNLSVNLNRFINNANTTAVEGGDVELLVLVILAIFIPPLSVFLVKGLRTEFWLDLILTCLFWVPGVIYALLVAFDVI